MSERVKFCVSCQRTIEWQAVRCRFCGQAQSSAKSKQGERARHAPGTAPPWEHVGAGRPPPSRPGENAATIFSVIAALGLIFLVAGSQEEKQTTAAAWITIGAALMTLGVQFWVIRAAILSANHVMTRDRESDGDA